MPRTPDDKTIDPDNGLTGEVSPDAATAQTPPADSPVLPPTEPPIAPETVTEPVLHEAPAVIVGDVERDPATVVRSPEETARAEGRKLPEAPMPPEVVTDDE